jgi:cold shock CspA family protein
LEPEDQTLQTVRALALTRQGRCKEAADVYENALKDIHLRPRKWRITTKDQAAECFRRYAEQDRAMLGWDSSKLHLARAYDILDEALASGDYDSHTASLYGSIFEDGMYFACHHKDYAYALGQIERLSAAIYLLNRISLRRLTREYVAKVFGVESEIVSKIAQIKGTILWAQWREETTQGADAPLTRAKTMGTVKNIPLGMSYGFIKDESGHDWFVHKSRLVKPEQWQALAQGKGVSFVAGTDSYGRRIAMEVALL